jgi:hypothetical protein
MGHQVLVIGTDRFRTLPLPSYPEIRLAWNAWRLPAMIDAFAPDSIHIATEGPLGLACPALLPAAQAALHHRLPHALSRISGKPPAGAAGLELCVAAPVSRPAAP